MFAVTKNLKTGDVAISFTAEDYFAPHVLLDYAARCEAVGAPEMARKAREESNRLTIWQKANGSVAPTDAKPSKKTEETR